MSISGKNKWANRFAIGAVALAVTLASAGVSARDGRHGYDDRYRGDSGYDYARVIDVEPLRTRVRVTTPRRECWDETRYDYRDREVERKTAGGALIGAVIGGVIGHQIGSGRGRDAATAAGAVIGAGIGGREAERRAAANAAPPRAYTVERCETRYAETYEERIDAYRVTYEYHGRRQVTELPYDPGDRIRVRVDVSPAQ